MTLAAGSVFFIRPGTPHQLRNPGEVTLRFICLIPSHEPGDAECAPEED